MDMIIRYSALPQGMDREGFLLKLAGELGEDGWPTGSGEGYVELELEDERANPKYGILAVRSYLQNAHFPPDTAIEMAGVPAGIYD